MTTPKLSISSGFVSNMLNPNQDTGVDAIFGQHAEATSQIDIPVTAIAEPSFFEPTIDLHHKSSLHPITNNHNPDTGYYSKSHRFKTSRFASLFDLITN
ncbi:hypothetical protein Tco_1448386 [Tanacetum coccineum]